MSTSLSVCGQTSPKNQGLCLCRAHFLTIKKTSHSASHVFRNKGVQFHETSLGFELPKPLAVSDVAVRILRTRYDHLSHYSEREQIQNKKSMMRGAATPPIEISVAEQVDNIEGDEAPKRVEEELRSVRSESRKVMMSFRCGQVLVL